MQWKGDLMELELGQLLIKEGLISAGQLEEALRNQVIYGVRHHLAETGQDGGVGV